MSAEQYAGTLVAGGGAAGAAAAIWLARAGRPVRLWEHDRLPLHRPCGGLMGPGAMTLLADLGADPLALGAVPVERIRLVSAAEALSAPLGHTAFALSRRTLDSALLDAAVQAGADVRRGVALREIGAGGVAVESHGAIRPAHLLLATGSRDVAGQTPVMSFGGGIGGGCGPGGFMTLLRLSPAQRAALAGHMDIMPFPGGLARLHPVEREAATLCVHADAATWRRFGADARQMMAHLVESLPHLAGRLEGAAPLLDRPLAFSARGCTATEQAGAWLLGDLAMPQGWGALPALGGDGLSFALHTARLATAAIVGGLGRDAYETQLRRDVRGPVLRTGWLRATLARPDGLRGMLLRLAPWAMPMLFRGACLPERAVARGMAMAVRR